MKKIYLWATLLSGVAFLYLPCLANNNASAEEPKPDKVYTTLQRDFLHPPREFTLLPFWFWNDELKEEEIIRQINDFDQHGVHGFTIHPRIGLPKDTGWLSDKMIQMMRVALKEAKKRDMRVMLYDDGMYPSGSSSGQVVAAHPEFASRGLSKIELKKGEPVPPAGPDARLITVLLRPNGERIAIYDEPSGGRMRGLHFIGDENVKNPREELPPTADVLNPKAVECFVQLVYQRYYDEFREFFDGTIVGIFTDEPDMLGRGPQKGMVAGQSDALNRVNKILGYDFTPYLADLWHNDTPQSEKRRNEYYEALQQVFEESYYGTISKWCRSHHVSLAGHPALSSDSGVLAKFDIPGQDIVWRYIEPGEKAFSPVHSMMGKVASSAMIHHGQRRNLNEVYGAYGHNLTFEEVKWIANWCFIRGHNMLLPHAFYYSIRGPRFEERPPDVGPNSSWWKDYKPYADACSRLCWLNTDSTLIASVAILVNTHEAAVHPATPLFENQIDFNYLEFRDLVEKAKIDEKGVHLAGMNYRVIILPDYSSVPAKAKPVLEQLAKYGLLVAYGKPSLKLDGMKKTESNDDYLRIIREKSSPDVVLSPSSRQIRVRHLRKNTTDFYLLFNEVNAPVETKISVPIKGKQFWWNVNDGSSHERKPDEVTRFEPFELKLICITR